MIYFVRRIYVVDPPVRGTREIERILGGTLTRWPDVDGARVFAKLVGDTIKGFVIEVAVDARDHAAASKQGRDAIRSALQRVGIARWDVRLANGFTSQAPSSTDG